MGRIAAAAILVLVSGAAAADPLALEQVSATPLPASASVTYQRSGENNTARFNSDTRTPGVFGSNVELRLVQSGDGHAADLQSVGAGNLIELNQSGSNNRAAIRQFGDGMRATIRQAGANNVITLDQQAFGAPTP